MMQTNSPCRKKIRLKNYDYSQAGYYFITICTENKKMLLWPDAPADDNVRATNGHPYSAVGEFIETALKNIESKYTNALIDKYIIMPNHIHLILVIKNCTDIGRPMVAPTVSQMIQQFKGYVSKNCKGFRWQKSYHDHIIRNEAEYRKIWEYIDTNPAKWQEDEYFAR